MVKSSLEGNPEQQKHELYPIICLCDGCGASGEGQVSVGAAGNHPAGFWRIHSDLRGIVGNSAINGVRRPRLVLLSVLMLEWSLCGSNTGAVSSAAFPDLTAPVHGLCTGRFPSHLHLCDELVNMLTWTHLSLDVWGWDTDRTVQAVHTVLDVQRVCVVCSAVCCAVCCVCVFSGV